MFTITNCTFVENENSKVYRININVPVKDFNLDFLSTSVSNDLNRPVTVTLALTEAQFLEVKSQVDNEAVSGKSKVCSCDIMVLMAKGCQCTK